MGQINCSTMANAVVTLSPAVGLQPACPYAVVATQSLTSTNTLTHYPDSNMNRKALHILTHKLSYPTRTKRSSYPATLSLLAALLQQCSCLIRRRFIQRYHGIDLLFSLFHTDSDQLVILRAYKCLCILLVTHAVQTVEQINQMKDDQHNVIHIGQLITGGLFKSSYIVTRLSWELWNAILAIPCFNIFWNCMEGNGKCGDTNNTVQQTVLSVGYVESVMCNFLYTNHHWTCVQLLQWIHLAFILMNMQRESPIQHVFSKHKEPFVRHLRYLFETRGHHWPALCVHVYTYLGEYVS